MLNKEVQNLRFIILRNLYNDFSIDLFHGVDRVKFNAKCSTNRVLVLIIFRKHETDTT